MFTAALLMGPLELVSNKYLYNNVVLAMTMPI
jgi:hypothetical protein